jgi:holo-[acyl-carrier protein] synthase
MKIISHGIDLVSIERIREMVSRHGSHFLERVYTPGEIAYAGDNKKSAERLAGRFAAKEAVLKLIGTGLRGKMSWLDIETLNDELGRPLVSISGEVKAFADKHRIEQITISITHTHELAMASAVAFADVL